MNLKTLSRSIGALAIACLLSVACFGTNADAATVKNHPVNGSYVEYTYDIAGNEIHHNFTLPSSGTVTVNVQTQFSAAAILYNADTETEYDNNYGIHGTPTSPLTDTFKLDLEAGNYSVKIKSSENADLATGIYRIKVSHIPSGATETEPNDSFSQAMNFPRETLITGFVSWDNPNDFYKITLPADEKIAFTMIMYENAYGLTSKNVTLYNGDFEQKGVYPMYADAGGSETKEIELTKGVYYLKIDHCGLYDYTGKYQIRWKKAPVYVSKISISGNKSVNVGKKITLKAKVTPADADNKTVKWSTSAKSIATVSTSGVVTGKKIGKATITATSTDGTNVSATRTIYVGPKKVSSLKATAKGNKKVLIRWKKQKGISGIQVQYAKKKNFKGSKKKTVKTSSSATKATVKLTKGTYYIKVRAFATLDGKKYYGDWSSAKRVKIK